jgi:phenylacetate-CoA ligase
MHLLETEFIGEVLQPGTDRPVRSGEEGELVITNLGRWDMPVVRYRTGDIVQLQREPCRCGSPYVRFPGGVRGRTDEMMVIRGTNIYPSLVEDLVRARAEVAEFEIEVFRSREMLEMEVRLEVEPEGKAPEVAKAMAGELQVRLGLTVAVRPVPAGTLPRYELKARRFKIREDRPQ